MYIVFCFLSTKQHRYITSRIVTFWSFLASTENILVNRENELNNYKSENDSGFSVNDRVLVGYYNFFAITNRYKGQAYKRLRRRTYLVHLETGVIWRGHINQLKFNKESSNVNNKYVWQWRPKKFHHIFPQLRKSPKGRKFSSNKEAIETIEA